MSVSSTICEMLSIISQNLKRSHDHDHAHLRDYLSIQRLMLHMANQCTKFEVSSLSCPLDILGDEKFKMDHMMWPHSFQGQFVICRLGLVMINQHTKCEVSMFTHYEDMKGNAKLELRVVWEVWGCQRSPAVTANVTIQWSAYDFLFDFNRNYASCTVLLFVESRLF